MTQHKFQPHETAILAAFQRAFEEGEFILPLPNAAACVALRARAYSVTKVTRGLVEKGRAPTSLLEPLSAVSISIAGTSIRFRRKDQDPGLQALIAGLGGESAIELKTKPEEVSEEERAMMERMSARMTPSVPVIESTAVDEKVNAYLGKAPVVAPIAEQEAVPEPAHVAKPKNFTTLTTIESKPSADNLTPDGRRMAPGWVWDPETQTAISPFHAKKKGLA